MQLVSEANARQHWTKKASRAKDQRSIVGMILQSTVGKPPAFPLVVGLMREAPRRLDDDNLRSAFKAVRDGVADWLGVNDRDPAVSWRYRDAYGGVRVFAVTIMIEPRVKLTRPQLDSEGWIYPLGRP